MPLPALRGDFVGNDPAQRLRARNRELHVPEVCFGARWMETTWHSIDCAV